MITVQPYPVYKSRARPPKYAQCSSKIGRIQPIKSQYATLKQASGVPHGPIERGVFLYIE
jgi:hypothetical protein